MIESQIVEGCRRGNRTAQFELYNRYAKAMYNVCLRMVKNEGEAEDVLQESFVDIFNKIDSFRSESTVGAWIKRIVVNNCINKLRKNIIHTQELEEDRHDVGEIINNDTNKHEKVREIKKAISNLPDGFRMVATLYLFEGYDHAEIAQIMSISESTSKSQYHRAKAKIRSLLIA